ncbi:MAG TPA: asparagine synthase (glutamine-hydrolyzing) [Prolixibacteraceae bacterium]|nr:asparagine synthase (glutamine-hydrolyzing) [Prolixibacteraceae bacterium]
MCGIAGLYNYHSSKEPSTEKNIKGMLSMIKHRGPDESGAYLDQNIGIGSVRLSIIDLSSGQQPMSDITGRYWIVYNGEIFNYLELRSLLEKKGVRFRTNSDTEVVIQMYATYGADCLNQFNGQFAFCIWDKLKKEMFLARDRVGIRPLFYWSENGAFAFCSEIKGLFYLDQIERSLDRESLSQIFTFWTTLTPRTPFKNILELQPGHYMHVNSEGIRIKKYWSMNFASGKKNHNNNITDAIEELDAILYDAVKIRLRADVQVGAYLSGGLDSSVTTSYINDINPEILNTFSIGFADKDYDETAYQLEAAKYFGTNHTAFSCTSEDLAESFAETIWHTEFPILRTSPTPMFLLSKKVRESNIKVVITGEGADEFLGGYNIFKEAKIRRFWAKEPNSTARPKLLTKLYPYIPLVKDSSDLALKMFFGYKLNETENPLYSHLLRWQNTSRLKSFFSEDLTHSLNGNDPLNEIYKSLPDEFKNWSDLSKSQYLEATIFMSGYLLSSQGDRMAMGNSVEGRYPFLDYRLIEYCNNLPDNFKLNSLNEKFILKKLSMGKIPSSISNRHKQAYRAPITSSMFGLKSSHYIYDILSEESIKATGIFHPERVKTLLYKIEQSGSISETDQMALVGILSTQLLNKMFIQDPIRSNIDGLKNYRIINGLKN